jgi:hypothetical protein
MQRSSRIVHGCDQFSNGGITFRKGRSVTVMGAIQSMMGEVAAMNLLLQ